MNRRRSSRPQVAAAAAAAVLTALALLYWGVSLLVPAVPRLPPALWHVSLYGLLAWGLAACASFMMFLAVSVDDPADLARAAVRGSAPVLWILPALLLLALPGGVVEGAALVLIALSGAQLASQRAPRRYSPGKPAQSPPVMFSAAAAQPAWMTRSLFPVMLGALAMQTGIWFLCVENRLGAALSVLLAAALWGRSWAGREAARERRRIWPNATAFLLAFVLAWPSWRGRAAGDPPSESAGIVADAGNFLRRLARPPRKPARSAARSAAASAAVRLTAPAAGAHRVSGVPGVILRPRPGSESVPSSAAVPLLVLPEPLPRPPRAAPSAPIRLRLSANGPLIFPFNGEYHLFGAAHDRLPEGSTVEAGTPMDAAYLNTSGGTVVTEAVQPLIPPLDSATCGEVDVDVLSAEEFGAAATLQLVWGRTAEDLGTEFFGLARTNQETLEYAVPPRDRSPVTAIRLRFYSIRKEAATSARVAVVRFRLLARP